MGRGASSWSWGPRPPPEYVIAIGAGSITGDPARFAVLWMDPDTVAASFRMEGAFNDVSLALSPEASEAEVVHAVDRILTPYGGRGAFTRARQPSNLTLEGELGQLYGMSTILPLIFLAVAALLVNVVLSRVVHLQRPEIATLKAVGYTDAQVAFHFLELVLVVACLGTAVGIALGVDLGARLVGLYEQYFKFPISPSGSRPARRPSPPPSASSPPSQVR
jgi:putative ABC transport system permease protein